MMSRQLITDILCLSLDECYQVKGILEDRIKNLNDPNYPSFLNIKTEDLRFSGKAKNLIDDLALTTVSDVLQFGFKNLTKYRGCGEKTVAEIKETVMSQIPAEYQNNYR